jgi:hypothetical protein
MKQLKIYSMLLIIAITGSLISCSSSSASNSPGEVIIKSFDLLKSKQYDKIAKLYAQGDGKLLTNEETTKIEGLVGMAAGEHEKKGGIKDVTINEEIISEDGTTAKVKYTINYKNGKTTSDKANLIKVNGKWYMKI